MPFQFLCPFLWILYFLGKLCKNVIIDGELIISCNVVPYIDNECVLEVRHAVKKKNFKLELGKLSLTGTADECRKIHSKIQSFLQDKRPKELLVFINPKSGQKQAERIYKRHVKPILDSCGINADVTVTRRAKEVQGKLLSQDLSNYQGVIAVGGDGIYNEVMSGLVSRTIRDSGLDPNDPETAVLPASLPIGIIPAGSGNYTAQYLNGTKCPVTASLRILLGSCVKTNIASIHQGQTLSGYSGLILGFGLLGDMMRDCETYRWMGTKRFKVVPVMTMFKRRPVDVSVSYVPSDDKEETSANRTKYSRQVSVPIPRRSDAPLKTRPQSTPDLLKDIQEFRTISNCVYGLDTYPISMAPENGKMTPSFGTDDLTLLMTQKCKLVDHMKQLKKVDDEKPDCYDFEFVRQIKVQRYKVKVVNSQTGQDYFINCDGEIIRVKNEEFQVRLHKRVIKLFGSPQSSSTNRTDIVT